MQHTVAEPDSPNQCQHAVASQPNIANHSAASLVFRKEAAVLRRIDRLRVVAIAHLPKEVAEDEHLRAVIAPWQISSVARVLRDSRERELAKALPLVKVALGSLEL